MTDELAPPPSIKVSWVFGILAVFLLFLLIATYSSRMARNATDYDALRDQERLDILHKQQASDREILTTAAWVDQTKGTVRIPIDEALPQAIAALKAKPVKMGAAIPGSAPAAAPAATTNAAPAAAPAPPKPGEKPANK